MITVLAGGVGAARFLQGLTKVVPENEIAVIVNSGDDIELHGLSICPDLDIIMYTLAEIVDEERSWGIRGDTFHCLETLKKYGCETWFKLGDRDLATHIYRTQLLKNGQTLSEITRRFCQLLGLKLKILPMSDEKVETKIVTDSGTMHFQEYLVKRGAQDRVNDVIFEGAEKAKPAPDVISSIFDAEAIIICPSNPVVSIGTILSLKNVRGALKETKAKVVAITPIVGGAPVKGPADRLMQGLRLEASAYSVAHLYRDFLDVFVLDQLDRMEKKRIEGLGLQVITTNTLMKSLEDKVRLAETALKSVGLR